MKRICYMFVFALIGSSWCSAVLASNSVEYKNKEDVTGDGKEDIIQLEQRENELLQLKIGGKNPLFTVPLTEGEDPKLSIVDVNEDGVKDIFITIQSEKTNEIDSFAYSFKNEQKKNLKTPPLVNIQTKMRDQYKAEITILCKTHIVDMSKYKKHYEAEGTYKNGIYANRASLEVTDYIQLKPIVTASGKGIRGEQKIMEPTTGRSIGKIITAWFYKNDKWNLENIELETPLKSTNYYLHIN